MQAGSDPTNWTQAQWEQFAHRVQRDGMAARDERAACQVLERAARKVMATYTTSFYLVSRFLPVAKRRKVELIYAAVRYPDEVVDTFPLTSAERHVLLDAWAAGFERGIECEGVRACLNAGIPPFLSGFTQIVRSTGMPADDYRAFLAAMRRDIEPRPFATLTTLIDDYIYGSAIVVGYFLAWIYGPAAGSTIDDALRASRELGIALQLTNFLRDVNEDRRRGRLYLPLDRLASAGLDPTGLLQSTGPLDDKHSRALRMVVRSLATETDGYYQRAQEGLNAFAPDCRVAVRACIEVYRRLNARILQNDDCLAHRESVPLREKWAALPPSKYWRLPYALLGG